MSCGRIFLVAMLLAVGLSPAANAAPLPVPWDGSALVKGGQTPDEVPGANDWNCKPSAKHPRPVVLVHGLAATLGDNWVSMSPLLKNNDFCVFGLTYGRKPGNPYIGGLTPQEASAKELDAFVDRVLAATGAKKVDMVGHSQGTIMPRWWMSFLGGRDLVENYVMFTPLWEGTKLASADILLKLSQGAGQEKTTLEVFDAGGCGSCPQFVNGSSYLKAVDGVGKALPGVTYTNVVTKYDELVSPYTSGILNAPNAKNFVLQDVCAQDYAEHAAVAYDPMAGQIMLNALDPARARPVPCVLMLPSGAPNPPFVGLAADTAGAGASCTRGKAITVRVRARRGERIRRITAFAGGKRVARRHGGSAKRVKRVRIKGLAPGKRTISLRLVTNRGKRTVKVRRTVPCA